MADCYYIVSALFQMLAGYCQTHGPAGLAMPHATDRIAALGTSKVAINQSFTVVFSKIGDRRDVAYLPASKILRQHLCTVYCILRIFATDSIKFDTMRVMSSIKNNGFILYLANFKTPCKRAC